MAMASHSECTIGLYSLDVTQQSLPLLYWTRLSRVFHCCTGRGSAESSTAVLDAVQQSLPLLYWMWLSRVFHCCTGLGSAESSTASVDVQGGNSTIDVSQTSTSSAPVYQPQITAPISNQPQLLTPNNQPIISLGNHLVTKADNYLLVSTDHQ